MRLLTNLETSTHKLLQIILIGQPELRELLDRSELRQLAQRITGRYHLNPLSKQETHEYVGHRLRVAGAAGEIFTSAALREVYRLSSGIPRVINVCCDRALLGAYTLETRKVTPALVRRAASEVYGRRFAPLWLNWVAAAIVLAGVAVTVYAGITVWRNPPPGLRSAAKTPVARDRGGCARRAACSAGRGAAVAAVPAPAGKPVPLQTLLAANAAEHQRCGRIPPLALAVGHGDGRRSRSLRTGAKGRTRLPRSARLVGSGARPQPARDPHPERRSRPAVPRRSFRPR